MGNILLMYCFSYRTKYLPFDVSCKYIVSVLYRTINLPWEISCQYTSIVSFSYETIDLLLEISYERIISVRHTSVDFLFEISCKCIVSVRHRSRDLLTAWVWIKAGASEKGASDFGFGGGFCNALGPISFTIYYWLILTTIWQKKWR